MMRIPGWLFILGLLLLLLGTSLGSWSAYRLSRQIALDSGPIGLALPSLREVVGIDGGTVVVTTRVATSEAEPTALAISTLVSPAGGDLAAGVVDLPNPSTEAIPATSISATAVPIQVREEETPTVSWSDPRRITFLLMGVDERGEVNRIPSQNTDTMILVTVDPANARAAVLSIPRDLWVQIPGFKNQRINTAYKLGAAANYPRGGPGLAMDTVAKNLGIVVDYYIYINFIAFEESVDEIFPAGVQICVEEEIHDPDYPDAGFGTIDVRFASGCERMDGRRLLQYARTRATNDGDFGRSQRQQQVLGALLREIQSLGGMMQVITKIPYLFSQLASHFDTNLEAEEIGALVTLSGDIRVEDVAYYAIDERHVEFGVTAKGEQVLIPRQNMLSQLAANLLNPQTQDETIDSLQRSRQEAASLVILNGTGKPGLAATLRDFLLQQGLNTAVIGNAASSNQGQSTIRENGQAPWTARYVADLLSIPESQMIIDEDAIYSRDVTIVIGADAVEELQRME